MVGHEPASCRAMEGGRRRGEQPARRPGSALLFLVQLELAIDATTRLIRRFHWSSSLWG
jgi:hypothetical protein